MAMISMFWETDGTGHGPAGGYSQQRLYDLWRKIFITDQGVSEGVFKGVDNELAATGTSSPIAVNTGMACAYGFLADNPASENLAVATPVVGTTGGRVNVKVDWSAATVTLVANLNTDGVAAIPTLDQTPGTVWELPLYTFTITTGGVITLTDVRQFAHFATMVRTEMLDSNVEGKLVNDGNSHTHAGGSGAPIPATGLANGAVDTTARMADNIVDDTKVGNRVPQFYRRQGGSATDWTTPGTTERTPTTVRQQAGSITTDASLNVTVTFPVAFSQPPLVFCQIEGNVRGMVIIPSAVTASQFVVRVELDGGVQSAQTVFWFAVGAE